MARWSKIPKELIAIMIILWLWITIKLYENIVVLILIFIWITILSFIWIYFNGFSLNNNYYWIKNTPSIFTKIISIIIVITLGVSFINISSNTEYYKSQFQEWLQNWFSSIIKWFFAFRRPWNFLIKESKKELREDLSWSGTLEN